jgi:acetyl-CoA carboxylase carboxyl transferase subunit beta
VCSITANMSKLQSIFAKRREEIRQFNQYRRQIKPQTSKQNSQVTFPLPSECPRCETAIVREEWISQSFVCHQCGYTHRLGIYERLSITVDEGIFHELGLGYQSLDPFSMPDYTKKMSQLQKNGVQEAYRFGEASIEGIPVIIGVLDSYFMMGSMGSVVGEKVTLTFQAAYKQRKPVVLFIASGGARMQEGILSLMQMAKTASEIGRFQHAKLPYISVITHPTTGGVSASFAMLADIILAEPEALFGFAGPRVIEQTIRQTLPEGFQSAEFLLEKGFIDAVIPRKDLRHTIATLIRFHVRGSL